MNMNSTCTVPKMNREILAYQYCGKPAVSRLVYREPRVEGVNFNLLACVECRQGRWDYAGYTEESIR